MVSVGQSNAPINLSKGAKINLSKEAPGLKKIMVGLGWDTNKYSGRDDFDLDVSVFMVNSSGRTNVDGFIFYNNLKGPNDCVIHQGDNRTGEGEGDDEQIYIDLDLVPAEIEKIAVTVTIHEADRRGQNFGLVENAFCRLVNTENDDREVVHFDLGEDFSVETAIVVGELYKHNGDWKFNAIGQGFSGGLQALCRNYGLDAEYR
ncbi:MAG: TerD family protein [Lachnospiraceae bacterium]|nr:TerD family protein [Lachnospiraceae bacterium]